jgi:hypothetical protein
MKAIYIYIYTHTHTHTKEGGNIMLLLMKSFSHEHTGDDYEGFLKSIRPF